MDEAREKVAATARRFPRMGRQQLFRQAADRVRVLQQEVCGLASQIGAATRSAAGTAWRRKARKALDKVGGLLLAVTLAMTSAGPHAVAQNTAEWGQAVRAAEVITVHYIADRAEPDLRVAPRTQARKSTEPGCAIRCETAEPGDGHADRAVATTSLTGYAACILWRQEKGPAFR